VCGSSAYREVPGGGGTRVPLSSRAEQASTPISGCQPPAGEPKPGGSTRPFLTTFREDRTSGSTDAAADFLVQLERWAGADASVSGADLRAQLIEWLRAAQAAQPTMALVHQLAARAFAVVESGVSRGDRPVDLRRALQESCEAEQRDLETGRAAVCRRALDLLPPRRAWIATLSASSVVHDAILAAQAAGREPHVLVAESRPLLEGRRMAASLAERGVPVWLVVDAALPLVLSQAQQLWLGADAVTDLGVLNKIGSYAAALAAREHSVPAYALAGRRKFLPAATAALKILERRPDEVWDAAPKGVRPRNVYFELVPMGLLRGVVVEDAVLPPGEAAQLARERPLPDLLAGG
jgi:translation initiation factor 2B subunit (eIF-2B alpha/beta/delta family)